MVKWREMVGRGHPLYHRPQADHTGRAWQRGHALTSSTKILGTNLLSFADSRFCQNRKNTNQRIPSGPSLQQQILAFSNKLVSLIRIFPILAQQRISKTLAWFCCFANSLPYEYDPTTMPRKTFRGNANSRHVYPTRKINTMNKAIAFELLYPTALL